MSKQLTNDAFRTGSIDARTKHDIAHSAVGNASASAAVHSIAPSKRQPLWLKITFALTAALLTVALVSGEVMRYQLRDEYAIGLRERSEETFKLLSAVALEPVITEDIPQLQTIVEESGRLQPNIHAVRLVNEDGLTLASWERNSTDDPLKLIGFLKDLRFEGELFGTIHIDWSTQRLDSEVKRQVNQLRYSVVASLLVLTLIIILLIHVLAVRPIGKIHRRLLSLTQGDLDSRVDIRTSRELSLLGRSVNELASVLALQKLRERELEVAKHELFEAKELAEVTLHSIGDGVIATDAHGVVRYLNPVSEQLMGWSNNEAQDRQVDEVFHIVDESTGERMKNAIHQCLETGRHLTAAANTLLIGKIGREAAIESSASPIRNRDGKVVGAVMVFRDVTRARRMARKLEHQATHDALTGLVNRNEFIRILHQCRQGRAQVDVEHTLLYVDLDQFKIVNDTCGHAAGDTLLQQLSALISARLRSGDIFARLGGDEFGILLRGCPLRFAQKIAESVRKTVKQFRFVWKGKSFSIGASIGVIPMRASSVQVEELLRQADEACYMAKEKGRNRLHVFNENDESIRARRGEMDWLSRIDTALLEDRLVLYQQPIRPLRRALLNEGKHLEILVRLVDNNGKLVPPGAFVPAAERFGIMPKIDRWVVMHTFDWLRKHPDKMSKIKLCAINLSGNSLSDEKLLNDISQWVSSKSIKAGKICFELTETAAVANMAQARNFILSLKGEGCLFALDDFGSGLSSFAYLKNLPVDILKIDGMFVKDITHNAMSLAMVKSINEIGHIMGKLTVAEFVENADTLRQLEEIGVDYVQGYDIGKPTPLN